MSKNEVYLGIDTSCYTTSVALIGREGGLVGEARRILQVKPGCRGLQQSEMVFQHTRNLPILLEEVLKKPLKVIGIGVSARPRPLEDSYMPAFLVGLGLARSLAAVNEIPLWQISHQENHLEAGLWSAQGPDADRFLLLHASGGTTDLLLAEKQTDSTYALTQAGGSKDLHAGQFVDRVGVALGLQFPAGAALEQLAATAADCIELPVAVRQGDVSLSGPATAALRKIEAGADPAALAAAPIMLPAALLMRSGREKAVMNEVIYSVSELNLMIKSLLEGDRTFTNIQIQGEISNFKRYSSGHCYFTLKDAGGVLKAVMFRNQARSLRFEPQNGDTVVAIGRVGVYERDGVYQLYTDLLLPLGAGDLMLAYEELKKKLTEEGLFDSERKRELPLNPKTVGMITSPSGAAVRDMITVARRRNRGIKLLLFPVKVQGDGSAAEIVRAIRFMNKHRLADVLIVGRGGGSIEELWAFNEEPVVRAIAASEIPVVSAVGHETDFTLSDFAADRRAATPSQAAELVVADADSYLRYVEELTARGERVLVHQLEQAQHKLQRLQGSWTLAKPERWLEPLQQRTDMAMRQLQGRMESILQKRQHKFGLLAARLDALSPLTVLARGYSITKTDSGRALRSIADVRWGEELRTQVADGDVISVVQQVERREKQ